MLNPFSENFILKIAFVPSEERIIAIQNTVKSKFSFIDSLRTAINSIENIINNVGNSPKLTLNIGKTKYTNAQKMTILDLSWYAPYKQYGDLVLTGFIYLFFVWRLFCHIPSIINGTSSFVESSKRGLDR